MSCNRQLVLIASSIACAFALLAAAPLRAGPEEAAPHVRSDHWSFQPIERPDVPAVERRGWVRNPIDAFVLARLEQQGTAPSPEASPATLVRRLHLDLTGLPPSPEALAAALGDRRPDAWRRLVDRLLASPHFGERWAQPWLDLARYADSDGYEMDYFRPDAWRWRDWLIEAVNRDLPFDRFTMVQIAGDLLPGATWRQRLATGFHRHAPTNTENGIDQEEFRLKAIVDRVNTTATVWLGLTLGCAECHEHKYDPISQADYYRFFAFFNDRVDEAQIEVEPTEADRAAFAVAQQRYRDELQRTEAALRTADADERAKIEQRLSQLRKNGPRLKPVAAALAPRPRPRETHVHRRGNFLDRGPRVQPDVPAVLPPLGGRREEHLDRLDLARWLVDPRNPLTARVEVNRIWQQLFGAGLVATPGDFGTQGQPPSHPLLLDWLAAELPRRGWSRKAMIRLIVNSATYRQASALRADLAEVDPLNRLLARQNQFRLDAECLRDQYLAAAGLLNPQVGGPSFHPPLPPGLSKIGFKLVWKKDPPEQQYRRGMYIVTRRNLAYPMLTTFDRPDANVTCVRRERSSTPLQALTQLNDPLIVQCARALAARLLAAPARGTQDRIETAFGICLARRPTGAETTALAALVERLRAIYRAKPDEARELAGRWRTAVDAVEFAAWTGLARTIMNLDEFVTRE